MVNGETVRGKIAPRENPEVGQTGRLTAGVAADPDNIQYDAQELNRLYDETLKPFEEGEVVLGTIIQINHDEVLVDVGYKSEGSIPLSEFSETEKAKLKVGDQVEVYLEKKEDNNGLMVLSKEKANKIKVWEQISTAFEEKKVVEGRVLKKIKGGLTVDVGIPAFLPGSQVDLRPVKNLDVLLGKNLQLRIIKLNARRGNIVVSRRVLLEEDRAAKKQETLKVLKEGQVIEGTVKNITEYGAFIDLGGMDGLLHVTDMSWGRVRHPSELFVVGDKVEVVVLKIDANTEKISLGLKQKTEDPWAKVVEKYPVGTRTRGKVVSLVEYGAFVELEEGVEGLIHVSEMSWSRKIKHPSKFLAIGDAVEVMVLDVDKENKRISLGIKQTEPNPWELIASKYKVGDKITGKVRNLTEFGAFVEVEDGIDGLIHVSDMSWTQRIKHPAEALKKGEAVEAIILNVDPKNEKLSLGLKQLQKDPWDEIPERYPIGTDIRRAITRITDFGAFVEVEEGVEGLIHVSELDAKRKAAPQELLSVGAEMDMKVIRIDPQSRKIGLSIRAFQENLQQKDLKDFKDKQGQEQDTFEQTVLGEKLLKESSAQSNSGADGENSPLTDK